MRTGTPAFGASITLANAARPLAKTVAASSALKGRFAFCRHYFAWSGLTPDHEPPTTAHWACA